MSRLLALSRRLALAVAAIALIASWTASGARANIAYAYAEEELTITSSPDIFISATNPLSQTTANLNGVNAGSGTLHSLNAPQSLIGPGPGENSFVRFAVFAPPGPTPPIPAGTLPTAPGSSFARGDVVLSGVTGRAVSETYLNGAGQRGGGDGNNHITYTFTVHADGIHSIGYSFKNDLYTVTNAPGDSANASYSFGIILKEGGTTLTVTGVDPRLNDPGTISSPPNSDEFYQTGTGTFVTPVLLVGHTYNVTFSLDANTNATTAAVPEPATMALGLTALPLLGLGLARRRRHRGVRA